MIDEGEEVDQGQRFARSYDFFKHMTGVALVSVGGVFAFLDGATIRIDRASLITVLASLMLSGVTSLAMATTLAGLETKPMPHAKLVRQIRWSQIAASFFLAVGLGSFVPAFVDAARLAG